MIEVQTLDNKKQMLKILDEAREIFKSSEGVHKDGFSTKERYQLKTISFQEKIHMVEDEYLGQKDGDKITVLKDYDKHEVVMSNSMMERLSNYHFVKAAKGDVLVAGLGMGMILLALQKKKNVKSITVVEIDEELRDLVMKGLRKRLNKKVKIEIGNIFQYHTKKKFDFIYCDIWNQITGTNLPEMNALRWKLSSFLKKDGNLSNWRENDCIGLLKMKGKPDV